MIFTGILILLFGMSIIIHILKYYKPSEMNIPQRIIFSLLIMGTITMFIIGVMNAAI